MDCRFIRRCQSNLSFCVVYQVHRCLLLRYRRFIRQCPFFFLFFLIFGPWKIDYLLNLACGILASLGSRNVYKDMLNNIVNLIDHVVMNHQNQTRTNDIWGHVRYNLPLLVIYNNTSKAIINLQNLTKLEPLTLAWMLTIIQTPPRSNFPRFDLLFLCPLIACLFPLWNHLACFGPTFSPFGIKSPKSPKQNGLQGN
jgi:hypothetical protein